MNAIEQIKYLNDVVTKIVSGEVKIRSVVTRQGPLILCGLEVIHGERKERSDCPASRCGSILEAPASVGEATFLEETTAGE